MLEIKSLVMNLMFGGSFERQKICWTYHNVLYNQHQGMDAILEERNEILKSLIPSVPQLKHWKIAARNCKKFFQVTTKIFIHLFVKS
jgi:hypothetical protein